MNKLAWKNISFTVWLRLEKKVVRCLRPLYVKRRCVRLRKKLWDFVHLKVETAESIKVKSFTGNRPSNTKIQKLKRGRQKEVLLMQYSVYGKHFIFEQMQVIMSHTRHHLVVAWALLNLNPLQTLVHFCSEKLRRDLENANLEKESLEGKLNSEVTANEAKTNEISRKFKEIQREQLLEAEKSIATLNAKLGEVTNFSTYNGLELCVFRWICARCDIFSTDR